MVLNSFLKIYLFDILYTIAQKLLDRNVERGIEFDIFHSLWYIPRMMGWVSIKSSW